MPLADRCSRLDLAVTSALSKQHLNLAQSEFFLIQENPSAVNDRRRKYSLVADTAGGETLYVGSRKTCQFGRLYDKGAQLKEVQMPGWVWRYEVEFKKPLSAKVAGQLLQRADTESVRALVRAAVCDWFCSREIYVIFPRGSLSDWMDLLIEMHMTSDETTLSWLGKQVRPAIDRLKRAGKGEAVANALGIPLAA